MEEDWRKSGGSHSSPHRSSGDMDCMRDPKPLATSCESQNCISILYCTDNHFDGKRLGNHINDNGICSGKTGLRHGVRKEMKLENCWYEQ